MTAARDLARKKEITWTDVPCVVLHHTTPQMVRIKIGASFNAGHDKAVRTNLAEKLSFARAQMKLMDWTRVDIRKDFNKLIKHLATLYAVESEGSLRNDMQPLLLPERAVELIITEIRNSVAARGSTKMCRFSTNQLTVQARGPFYFLNNLDDKLVIALAEDIFNLAFPAQPPKGWDISKIRDPVLLKHTWRGYLLQNTLNVLAPSPPSKKAKAPSAASKLIVSKMLPFLLRGDFDVVGPDLRTEVDSLEDSPEMEKSVTNFVKALLENNLVQAGDRLQFCKWPASYVPNDFNWHVQPWRILVPAAAREATLPAQSDDEVVEVDPAQAKVDRYFAQDWDADPIWKRAHVRSYVQLYNEGNLHLMQTFFNLNRFLPVS